MSWAAHNPEKYSEIINKGIGRYLASLNKFDNFTEEDAALFAEDLENGSNLERRVWSILTDQAQEYIQAAEANYFAGLIDAARERQKNEAAH